MTQRMSFEEAIEIQQISENLYSSLHPPWTWPSSPVIPGGFLIALAARAAYATLPPDFTLDSVSAQFLAGPSASLPLQQRVTRLSDGGRFAARSVTIEQAGKAMVSVQLGFVNPTKIGGRAMEWSVGRSTEFEVPRSERLELDDLQEVGKDGGGGRWMGFQRLGLRYTGPEPQPRKPPPHSLTYTSAALILPLFKSPSSSPSPQSTPTFSPLPPLSPTQIQSLSLLPLSDYHLLDAPPTLSGLPFGLPRINDATRTRTTSVFERFTSLNHSVQFVRHHGWDTRGVVYVEVNCDWAGGRRGGVKSRIFQRRETKKEGEGFVEGKGTGEEGEGEWMLIAVCMQEGYYVMKEETEEKERINAKGGKEREVGKDMVKGKL